MSIGGLTSGILGGFGKFKTAKKPAALKGTANPKVKASAAKGRAVHKDAQTNPVKYYGKVVQTEYSVSLKNGSRFRFDGIDVKNGVVYELKPSTTSGISQGNKQLNNYISNLNESNYLGRNNWTGQLVTY